MTEDDFNALAERILDLQARADVMEKSFALFMATTHEPAAKVIEDWLRHYNENAVTSDDPARAARLKRADQAAVRLSDVIAATIGDLRRRRG